MKVPFTLSNLTQSSHIIQPTLTLFLHCLFQWYICMRTTRSLSGEIAWPAETSKKLSLPATMRMLPKRRRPPASKISSTPKRATLLVSPRLSCRPWSSPSLLTSLAAKGKNPNDETATYLCYFEGRICCILFMRWILADFSGFWWILIYFRWFSSAFGVIIRECSPPLNLLLA